MILRRSVTLGLLLLATSSHSEDCVTLTTESKATDLIDCIHYLAKRDTDTTWTSVGTASIGKLPMKSTQPVVYLIPDSVPSSAKEILVYVTLHSEAEARLETTFEIYTQEGSSKYSKYFYWYMYPQNSISFNSENMWFPLTAERKLFARALAVPVSLNNGGSDFMLIGYR